MTGTEGSVEQKVGLQLYTLRQQMREDAVATLRQVADIGYTAVELVGYGNSSAKVIDKTLRDLGVEAIGAHVAYEELDKDLERAIADLQLLGATFLVVQQARPADWSSAESVKRLAETFNAWGQRCHEAGLTLAYHGYHPIELEFAPLGDSTGYDLMVAQTDPSLVQIQLDTYWLHRLGRDPVQVLRDYAGRVPSLHLKDSSISAAGGDVPVGAGSTPWPDVLAAAVRCGTSWFIVEQEDDPDNAFRDIRTSLSFLMANWPPSAASEPKI
jgi:sugar phosphate isomerase/epimerase